MILVLVCVAIASGVAIAMLFWPYGIFLALIAAAVGSSLIVFLVAVALAYARPQSSEEPTGLANLLAQLIGRDRR